MTKIDIQKKYLQCVAYMIAKVKTFDEGFKEYERKHEIIVNDPEITTTDLKLSQQNFARSLENYKRFVARFSALDCPEQYGAQHRAMAMNFEAYTQAMALIVAALEPEKRSLNVLRYQEGCQKREAAFEQMTQLLQNDYQEAGVV
ncbi:hypothetical protein [Loigolactobacillus backii]|uniref:Uncharacterized protein n=1 Tax=Loigolactobacillus backii TaxID=375175 RepID=A0A192GZV4_9LACO|nr:hypothetical protein [Loigolactobacillus backii]ANK60798.1 hypothetical protein AYR52_11370 [Loigolactobacillus backii]ANK61630.1 hypothetical protein AYR53_01945 [Loigolactobacillus backii]ANK65752.1 hypothetical protein AYR54_11165 [Loigolactobacillus backii]ANK68228.1 hypothetical protein AYR55_11315 [Loigolactobacillus backii]ANK69170.1 hypothetical protein AYR56_02765 [Loigolactobacillus backii]